MTVPRTKVSNYSNFYSATKSQMKWADLICSSWMRYNTVSNDLRQAVTVP